MKNPPGHRRRRARRTPGLLPGTLLSPANARPTSVRVTRMGHDGARTQPWRLGDALPSRGPDAWVWVDVCGLAGVAEIAYLGEALEVHALTLEDALHTGQGAKIESFDTYDAVVLRVPSVGTPLSFTQVTLVLGAGFILSLDETDGAVMDALRTRILQGRGGLTKLGPDYLTYAALDVVIDAFFPLLEGYADRLDALEGALLRGPVADALPRLYGLKEALRELRRAVWPLRDALHRYNRDPGHRLTPNTVLHLRDCEDHVRELVETIDAERDSATALMELHVATMGNRLNEVMKVLTMIATVFIPLSFITGLYGMNFDPRVSPWNMPELRWVYGYPAVLGLMLVVVVVFFGLFWRLGWLARGASTGRDEGGG